MSRPRLVTRGVTPGAVWRWTSGPPARGACPAPTIRSARSFTGAWPTRIRTHGSCVTVATTPCQMSRRQSSIATRPWLSSVETGTVGLVLPGTAGRRLGRRPQSGTHPGSHARESGPAIREMDQSGADARNRTGRRHYRRRRRRHVCCGTGDRSIPVGAAVPIRRSESQHERRRCQRLVRRASIPTSCSGRTATSSSVATTTRAACGKSPITPERTHSTCRSMTSA